MNDIFKTLKTYQSASKNYYSYWYERKVEDDKAYRKTEDECLNELKKLYKDSLEEINTELGKFYLDYSVDNKITLQDAQKLLTGKELQKLKENISIWEEEYKNSKITDSQYQAKLNALKYRLKVQRAEALKFNLESKVFKLYSDYTDKTENFLFDIYKLADKNTKYNLTKLVGNSAEQKFGINFFNTPSDKLISEVINTPWCGDNYSDTIWKNKTKLVESLNRNITQSFIQGKHYKETATKLSKEMNVKYSDAKRIIRTESKYVISKSEVNVYKNANIDEYEYVASIDEKTSNICLSLDGKIFKMSEAISGLNLPPMHPYCRSYIIPLIEEIMDMEENRVLEKDNPMRYNKDSEDKKDKFVPAKDLKEAEKYAKEKLQIINADFKDVSIEFANCMNRVIKESYDEFPALLGEIKYIGTAQRRNKLFIDNVLEPDIRKQSEKWYGDKGYDIESPAIKTLIENYVKKSKSKFIAKNKVSANTNASATTSDWKGYQGIAFNKNKTKDIKAFNKLKNSAVSSGWSAKGTGSARGTMFHEFGHQITFYLEKYDEGKEAIKKIQNIYNEKGRNYIKKELSEYGSKTYHEFIAETWAEYKMNPNCRELSKEISNIIIEAMESIDYVIISV